MMKLLALAALVVFVICAREIKQSEAAPGCYNGASTSVQFTQYWIPREGSKDVNDDGDVITLSGPKTKRIVRDDGSLIESTDANTYSKCVEEGTCFLLNGDLVNLASSPETFQVLDKSQFPYGQGASGRKLAPFVSVAANDLAQGTTLFVSQLKNWKLPNGQTHNGCVRVDDKGVGFSCHIDWFVVSYANEVKLSNLPERATVKATNCQVLNYGAGNEFYHIKRESML